MPVCGHVIHTTMPADGLLTVEVVSSHGDRFPLVVGDKCCRLDNPGSVTAMKGDDVPISVELPSSATASESFVVTAAMSKGSTGGH